MSKTATFTLYGMQPFSINSTYAISNGRKFKTSAASEWTYQVFNQLAAPENQTKLEQLRSNFNPLKEALQFTVCAYYPRPQFFKKKGGLSAKTHDLSNWEKILIDCFCLPKFHTVPIPYGAPNLNMDDKYVVKLASEKRPCDGEPYIEVSISVVDVPYV